MRSLLTACSLLALTACGGRAAAPTAVANHTATTAGGLTVRAIDWQNRTYTQGGAAIGYPVVDGEYAYALDEDGKIVAADYQPKDPDAYVERGWFMVAKPVFGDVDGDGAEEALIITFENTGGSGQFTMIEVYTIRGGQEVVLGHIPGGDRGDGGISDVSLDGRTVVVDRLHAADGDGACCPSKLQRERWQWDGAAFVEDEAARVLTDLPE